MELTFRPQISSSLEGAVKTPPSNSVLPPLAGRAQGEEKPVSTFVLEKAKRWAPAATVILGGVVGGCLLTYLLGPAGIAGRLAVNALGGTFGSEAALFGLSHFVKGYHALFQEYEGKKVAPQELISRYGEMITYNALFSGAIGLGGAALGGVAKMMVGGGGVASLAAQGLLWTAGKLSWSNGVATSVRQLPGMITKEYAEELAEEGADQWNNNGYLGTLLALLAGAGGVGMAFKRKPKFSEEELAISFSSIFGEDHPLAKALRPHVRLLLWFKNKQVCQMVMDEIKSDTNKVYMQYWKDQNITDQNGLPTLRSLMNGLIGRTKNLVEEKGRQAAEEVHQLWANNLFLWSFIPPHLWPSYPPLVPENFTPNMTIFVGQRITDSIVTLDLALNQWNQEMRALYSLSTGPDEDDTVMTPNNRERFERLVEAEEGVKKFRDGLLSELILETLTNAEALAHVVELIKEAQRTGKVSDNKVTDLFRNCFMIYSTLRARDFSAKDVFSTLERILQRPFPLQVSGRIVEDLMRRPEDEAS